MPRISKHAAGKPLSLGNECGKNKMMQKLNIKISEEIGSVSAILQKPAGATALLVLSHGAGAGMEHPFMQDLADQLALQKVATLRFNFPFKENGGAPDRPPKAQATVQAAIAAALPHAKGLTLLVGGKSFGGRMTSLLAASGTMSTQVKGIVYVGFPLHAPGKPGIDRAAHLQTITVPQLFLQGTRDTLAQFDLIEQVCSGLGRATLVQFEGADHSFQTLKRSGMSAEKVMTRMAFEIAVFAARFV
jgi:predicted alpha/beta-hydrolase family hydrolase